MFPTQDNLPHPTKSALQARNDQNISTKGSTLWPTIQAQNPVLEPLPIAQPAPPTSATADFSANSAWHIGSKSVTGDIDLSVNIISTTTADSSRTAISQSEELGTETSTSHSGSRKTKKTSLSKHGNVAANAPKIGFIRFNLPGSFSLESFRNFVRPTKFSDESLANGHVATLGRKQGIRPYIFSALEDQLKTATQPSNREHWIFLSRRDLTRLVTKQSIKKEFARKKYRAQKELGSVNIPLYEDRPSRGVGQVRSRSETQLLQKSLSGTCIRIFAILMFLQRPDTIVSFLAAGVCDADLPLEIVKVKRGSVSQLDVRRQKYPELPFSQTCFKGWGEGDIWQFEKYQWVVLAPTFTKSEDGTVPHFEFHSDEVMPFTWKQLAEGGFGQVFEARIHPDHHEFDRSLVRRIAAKTGGGILPKWLGSRTQYDVVAVKKLHPRNDARRVFEREAGVLRNLSKKEHIHPHLVTLLATYEQDMNYYLVFPWADADLERFWETTKPEPRLAQWVLKQCQGLASGLYKVHRYLTKTNTTMSYERMPSHEISQTIQTTLEELKLLGRHGDIKPNNILWYRDGSPNGILKITDFGIAQFTINNKMDSARRKGRVPNSPTYRSPECDIKDAPISSQCDIWALGCVYLVFTVWLFDGWKSVKRFADSRKYDILSRHGKMKCDEYSAFFAIKSDSSGNQEAVVKPSVTEMIKYLLRQKDCDDGFRKLLNHVQHDMLIVRGPDVNGYLKIPENTATRRMSSGHLATELSSLQLNTPKA